MKKVVGTAALLALLIPAGASAQQALKLPRPSPKASVVQTVGLTDVTINYCRPGVKGRTIWGDLVPYDKVWRTGANEATTIQFSQDVKVNGKPLPAGLYSLHTIPGKSAWTVIFNKKAEQWGSYDYSEKEDALRVQVTPGAGPMQEYMAFSFPEVTPDGATIELAWEKVRVPFKIEVATKDQAMASIRQALSGDVKEWNVPYGAANYAFTNNVGSSDEAMKWVDQSVSLKETYWNLRLKAAMLDKAGKRKEAVATAEKAVQVGKANQDDEGEIAKTEKQIAEWKGGKS
ncbi:MAG TPA: DUF2911 domain-containing protein [Candidatus Polarisedimenticolia bacterium]|jgi:hypothetical protein|nr:DUF2911 domain-containing protein [Candidatus Polarisedimenticolia bacterium]